MPQFALIESLDLVPAAVANTLLPAARGLASGVEDPTALAAMTLMMHVLVAADAVFGIGRGGPKRQSALVQVRLLPVSVEVRLASVRSVALQHTLVRLEPMSGTVAGSGTLSSPPPK